MVTTEEVIGLVTGAGTAFAVAYSWMTKQVSQAKLELTSQLIGLSNKIEKMELRISELENTQKHALGKVIEARVEATFIQSSKIEKLLLEAEDKLK